MHIDDQDVYIRRNLVALSFTIIAVSLLEIPVGAILQRLLQVETAFEPWKVALLTFGAFLYLIWRLKVSAEGVKFRRQVNRLRKHLVISAYVRDIKEWANIYIRGGEERLALGGGISKAMNETWTKLGTHASEHRKPTSRAFLALVNGSKFPRFVDFESRFTGCETVKDGVQKIDSVPLRLEPTLSHIAVLVIRSDFYIHFSHKLGMDVTVPMVLCGVAQACVFANLIAAYH